MPKFKILDSLKGTNKEEIIQKNKFMQIENSFYWIEFKSNTMSRGKLINCDQDNNKILKENLDRNSQKIRKKFDNQLSLNCHNNYWMYKDFAFIQKQNSIWISKFSSKNIVHNFEVVDTKYYAQPISLILGANFVAIAYCLGQNLIVETIINKLILQKQRKPSQKIIPIPNKFSNQIQTIKLLKYQFVHQNCRGLIVCQLSQYLWIIKVSLNQNELKHKALVYDKLQGEITDQRVFVDMNQNFMAISIGDTIRIYQIVESRFQFYCTLYCFNLKSIILTKIKDSLLVLQNKTIAQYDLLNIFQPPMQYFQIHYDTPPQLLHKNDILYICHAKNEIAIIQYRFFQLAKIIKIFKTRQIQLYANNKVFQKQMFNYYQSEKQWNQSFFQFELSLKILFIGKKQSRIKYTIEQFKQQRIIEMIKLFLQKQFGYSGLLSMKVLFVKNIVRAFIAQFYNIFKYLQCYFNWKKKKSLDISKQISQNTQQFNHLTKKSDNHLQTIEKYIQINFIQEYQRSIQLIDYLVNISQNHKKKTQETQSLQINDLIEVLSLETMLDFLLTSKYHIQWIFVSKSLDNFYLNSSVMLSDKINLINNQFLNQISSLLVQKEAWTCLQKLRNIGFKQITVKELIFYLYNYNKISVEDLISFQFLLEQEEEQPPFQCESIKIGVTFIQIATSLFKQYEQQKQIIKNNNNYFSILHYCSSKTQKQNSYSFKLISNQQYIVQSCFKRDCKKYKNNIEVIKIKQNRMTKNLQSLFTNVLKQIYQASCKFGINTIYKTNKISFGKTKQNIEINSIQDWCFGNKKPLIKVPYYVQIHRTLNRIFIFVEQYWDELRLRLGQIIQNWWLQFQQIWTNLLKQIIKTSNFMILNSKNQTIRVKHLYLNINQQMENQISQQQYQQTVKKIQCKKGSWNFRFKQGFLQQINNFHSFEDSALKQSVLLRIHRLQLIKLSWRVQQKQIQDKAVLESILKTVQKWKYQQWSKNGIASFNKLYYLSE